ncbi:protein CASP-like [Prunus dulcis]|uniref:protein CASP-like n=1 Tax=Prunus dulcis TaxID=3755 RepID=UPI00148298D3|nr:protein CASP-like [Prunus dulcis]
MSKDERAVLMVESGVEMIGFLIHKKEKPTKTILHSSKSSPLGSQFILSECAFEATCFKESAVCLASGRDRQKEIVESADEERATKQSEVNLLMDEVERAQTWLLRLERGKGLLRFKLDTANEDTENKKSDTSDSYSILENSLIAKEKIIAELNMELHNIETTLSNEREEHLKEIKKLNTLLIEKEAALGEMKKELQGRPTTKLVDDLRKKVKILQGCSSKDKKGILFDDSDLSEARSTEVSEEIRQLKEKIGALTAELEKTKADNVKLYGKIRYVQD